MYNVITVKLLLLQWTIGIVLTSLKVTNVMDMGWTILITPHKLQGLPSISFTAMVYNGYTPDGFDIATIQPLLKINKRTSSKYSNKYRTVAFYNI